LPCPKTEVEPGEGENERNQRYTVYDLGAHARGKPDDSALSIGHICSAATLSGDNECHTNKWEESYAPLKWKSTATTLLRRPRASEHTAQRSLMRHFAPRCSVLRSIEPLKHPLARLVEMSAHRFIFATRRLQKLCGVRTRLASFLLLANIFLESELSRLQFTAAKAIWRGCLALTAACP
jgi:hypothetical protein